MADLIYGEMELFVVCLLLGAFLAMVYDGIRIFRMCFRHREFVVDVEDLLFWLFTAWMVFRTLFYYNRGTLRGYAFFGLFLGVLIYTLTFSRVFLFFAGKLVPIFRKGWNLVTRPIRYLKEWIRKSLKKMRAEVTMAWKSR